MLFKGATRILISTIILIASCKVAYGMYTIDGEFRASNKAVLEKGIYNASLIGKTESKVHFIEDSNIKILCNGNRLTLYDTDGTVIYPHLVQGKVYLPIRALGNAIGQSTIEWDSDHNISYIKANNNEVETWSGSNVVIVNGKDVVKIDETSNNVCAYTSEGRTYPWL